MTYRTLITTASALAFMIGGIGVAFEAFAQETAEVQSQTTYIYAGEVLVIPDSCKDK